MAVLNGFELFLGQGFDAFERFTGRRLAPHAAQELEATMWRRVAERPNVRTSAVLTPRGPAT